VQRLKPIISATWEVQIGRIVVGPMQKSMKPYLKINYSKKGVGVWLK
jgi:hypothetical protein